MTMMDDDVIMMIMMMMTDVQDCTVIYIVLGISFDQGRMLKMPE